MNKTYFKYLFNKDKHVNIVISVILFILMPLMMIIIDNNPKNLNISAYYTFFVIVLLILTYILPVFSFSYLHSKRAVDTYMQLPLKKQEVFRTKFLYTVFQAFIPWFLNFLLANLVFIAKYQNSNVSLKYIVFIFIIAGILTFSLISFNTYIYQKCNNLIDGIILIIMYHILLASFVGGIYSFLSSNAFVYLVSGDLLTFLILDYDFVKSLIITDTFNCDFVISVISSKEFIFCLFIGVMTFALSLHDIQNRKSERAESNTNTYLGYPLIITSFVLIILLQFNITGFEEYSILVILTFVLYMIGIFIYKRRIKIKIKYIVVYVLLIIIANLFNLAFFKTNGFNLDKELPTNYKYSDIYIENGTSNYYEYSSIQDNSELFLLINEIYEENRLEYYDSYFNGNIDDFRYYYEGNWIQIIYRNGPSNNYKMDRKYVDFRLEYNQTTQLLELLGGE